MLPTFFRRLFKSSKALQNIFFRSPPPPPSLLLAPPPSSSELVTCFHLSLQHFIQIYKYTYFFFLPCQLLSSRPPFTFLLGLFLNGFLLITILFYFTSPPLTDWYIYNFLALSKDFDCQSALQIFGNARSDSISAPFSFEKIRRRTRQELLIEHQQLSPVKLWRSFCSVCSTQTEQLNCDIVRTGRFWSVVKMYKTWSVWQLLLIIPIWQLEWLTVWFVITMIVSRRRGWGFRNGNLEHGLELKMFVSSFVEVTSLNESNRVVGDEWTRSVYCNLQYNSVERVTIVFIERTSMII